MNNKNIGLIAILGVAGYIAYTMFGKSSDSGSGSYNPSRTGGGSSGGKKTLTFEQIMTLMNATLDTFSQIQLTYDQKFKAIKDLESLINSGKGQREIEIIMQQKYKLNPSQVQSMVNKIYK
jgi:hypothetical protein